MSSLYTVIASSMLLVLGLSSCGDVPNQTGLALHDQGCHYPLKEGQTRVSPKLRIDPDVSMNEWATLKAILAEFAVTQKFDVRDLSESRPDIVETINFSLCTESLIVLVAEQRWAVYQFEPQIIGRGTSVRIFTDLPDEEWQTVARSLVSRLDEQWPGSVRFLNTGGRFVSRPSYLREE